MDDDRVVGTSTYTAARREDMTGWAEIISIYLLPEYWGRGLGRRLMQTAVAGLSGLGFQDVYLWVLEENHRARRFYERFGFHPSGAFLDDNIGGKTVRELQYVYQTGGAIHDP